MVEPATLRCPECGFAEQCGGGAMIGWLRRARMVRPGAGPEPELLGELFRAAGPKLACPKCGRVGLAVERPGEEDDESWGMGRACEGCGKPVPRERLEALPDTRLCVACQHGDDHGKPAGPAEYCPRCGNIMVVRQARGAGLTRYVSECPQCRR